jgi:hypothetical protein
MCESILSKEAFIYCNDHICVMNSRKLSVKAQVSLFLLLGLMLVLFVAFFAFYAQEQITLNNVGDDNDITRSVSASFSSCLESQLADLLPHIAVQGGYYVPPSNTVEEYFVGTFPNNIPYYFVNEAIIVPSVDVVQEQIALALVDRVEECTDFSDYPYDVSVSQSSIDATIIMYPTSVDGIVDVPLTIVVEGATYTLETFTLEVSSNIYTLHNAALVMTEEQRMHPDEICLTCLTSIAQENNFYLGMIETSYENQYTILYLLNDRDSNGDALSFYFGHTFSLEETETGGPAILDIVSQEAIIGYLYEYHIIADGEDLVYTDDSDIFDINPATGLISFIPNAEDLGSSIVTITVTNANGEVAERAFVFTVNDVLGSSLSIDSFPYFVAHIDEEFSYTVLVDAEEEVFFFDDTDLFDIDPYTGKIVFTPSSTDTGSYEFTITVTDTLGTSTKQEGYVVIV